VLLIIPPIIGVITYVTIRYIWERDENAGNETVMRRDPSAATSAEGTSADA
jgi:hypothetical protein